MELVIESARTGDPSARLGSTRLHSAYDPRGEAARFIAARLKGEAPALIVVAGACLGYLIETLRARYPFSRILSLQYDRVFLDRELPGADARWAPGGQESLASFLAAHIDEEIASGFAFLEWEPASRAFPEEAAQVARRLKDAVERASASAATLKTFGRLWFANACRNFLLVEHLAAPGPLSGPIVVAAAGPSLEEALADLAPYKGRFRLIAVSSALASCRAQGFEPDIVAATDGGFWGRAHLYPLAAHPALRAMPLSACASACLAHVPLLILAQSGYPERELAAALGVGLPIPSHGTVAGVALRLAHSLGTGEPILTAGFDLAARDLCAHARPHGFDAFIRDRESRTSPLEGRLFARESEFSPLRLAQRPWRVSRSLATYAAALSDEAPGLSDGVFRLRPSPVPLSGFVSVDSTELAALLRGPTLPPLAVATRTAPTPAERRVFLKAFLGRARDEAVAAARTLAAGQSVTEERSMELLKTVDLVDWAAVRRALHSGRDARPASEALERTALDFLDSLKRRLIS